MRAKFNVQSVKQENWGEEVVLSAVYSNESNTEDNQFSQATPNGRLTMTISNPGAKGFLELGESYYLDFSKAPKKY
jgi:hypothetical protein